MLSLARRSPLTVLALLALSGCGGSAEPVPAETASAPDTGERVRRHLLERGAVIAAGNHELGYWFKGSLRVPAGGTTCAVASITVGAHGPLVTDAVYDSSGTVTVRLRSAAEGRARCLAAVRRMLAGFDADAQ